MYFKTSLAISVLVLFALHVTTATAKHESDVVYESKNKAPLYCINDRDCRRVAGNNSKCYYHQCICNLGYRSINAYCTKVNCTWNSDCTRYFYNTRCQRNAWRNSSCVCDYGTHLDWYSQTCLYNSGDSGLYIGLPMGLILFVGLLACCCCCCKRRRQVETQILLPPPRTIITLGPSTQQVPPAYQGSYQNAPPYPSPIYPSLNSQAPPPYNPHYTSPYKTKS